MNHDVPPLATIDRLLAIDDQLEGHRAAMDSPHCRNQRQRELHALAVAALLRERAEIDVQLPSDGA
jgi:hypothetical protein